MSVINTNITAMIGQQNLGRSQSALQTSMERLSSGLRINSAKDDAAGQAIANRMSAQITGLSQAQRNANDGISVAQTAEGALNQVNDNLQRIRELTVQAQNGTNSSDDLQSIQDEINQRLDEVNRISSQTDFNGVKVLGTTQKLSIQVGANDGEAITIDLQKIDATTLGMDTFNVTGPNGTPTTAGANELEAILGETTSVTDFSITGNATNEFDNELMARLGFDSTAGTSSLALDTAAVHKDDNGNLFAKVTINTDNQTNIDNLAARGIEVESGVAKELYIALSSDEGSVNGTDFEFDLGQSFARNLDFSSLSSGQTTDPLDTIDDALKQVDTLRSDLGAIQNRFESAITNLSTNETNLSAARSRIEDADYAVEVSNMTRAQILQQAGTSVLAQANQVPQSVLSLLG
ncbi:FliC/FljB family flagellin [Alloalcanivorax xenomutans]|uniref:FliC/FljB family flagellin n=1 Tax=Alloalcanivorax xenomutans TaxID=1094342 RepID=UPI0029311AD8|nr:FliC/FljB family flagellin [Alloalcanivorax xenomutans]WOA30468.1 FliC/FljB family flagellin [Alloalcanivorax xenomutans]